jgi:membrane protein DedA with SNARE-associated domain/rhodanese-related sulfurtransferase
MNALFMLLVDNGYAILFGWVFLEQLGLPIPAAPFFLAAGALARAGHLDLTVILCVAVIASLVSDLFWYQVGRIRGLRVLSLLCRISLDPDTCKREIKQTFVRHGSRSLLVAKFIPGLSTAAPPLAGILDMSLPKFVLFDGLGALLWVGVFAGIGYRFSSQIEYIAAEFARLGTWSAAVIAGCLTAYITWKYYRRKRFLHGLTLARITPEEVKQRLDAGEDLMILDVRAPFEFSAQPFVIPGALSFPLEQIEANHDRIPRDRDIVLCCYCANEIGSVRAALSLRRQGITRVRPLEGGIHGWLERAFPVEHLNPQGMPSVLPE